MVFGVEDFDGTFTHDQMERSIDDEWLQIVLGDETHPPADDTNSS